MTGHSKFNLLKIAGSFALKLQFELQMATLSSSSSTGTTTVSAVSLLSGRPPVTLDLDDLELHEKPFEDVDQLLGHKIIYPEIPNNATAVLREVKTVQVSFHAPPGLREKPQKGEKYFQAAKKLAKVLNEGEEKMDFFSSVETFGTTDRFEYTEREYEYTQGGGNTVTATQQLSSIDRLRAANVASKITSHTTTFRIGYVLGLFSPSISYPKEFGNITGTQILNYLKSTRSKHGINTVMVLLKDSSRPSAWFNTSSAEMVELKKQEQSLLSRSPMDPQSIVSRVGINSVPALWALYAAGHGEGKSWYATRQFYPATMTKNKFNANDYGAESETEVAEDLGSSKWKVTVPAHLFTILATGEKTLKEALTTTKDLARQEQKKESEAVQKALSTKLGTLVPETQTNESRPEKHNSNWRWWRPSSWQCCKRKRNASSSIITNMLKAMEGQTLRWRNSKENIGTLDLTLKQALEKKKGSVIRERDGALAEYLKRPDDYSFDRVAFLRSL